MKRMAAVTLFTVFALAATGLSAQETALKASIPFGFTAGDQYLPAGEYTISSPYRGMVKIVSADRHSTAIVATLHSFQESATGNSELVFERDGEQHFLQQILSPAHVSLNLNVAQGKEQKRVRTLEANRVVGNQILVAAR